MARHDESTARALATGLGWFSIGLGLSELLATRSLTRALGMRGHERLVEAYGLREIATGIGLLTAQNQAPWLWGRVAGDALDLATLSGGLTSDNPQRRNVGIAIAAVVGATALDVIAAQKMTAVEQAQRRPRRDYRGRSGFPRGPQAVRGTAAQAIPADFREPPAMRPPGWNSAVIP